MPWLNYEMYDVMIEVPPLKGEDLAKLDWVHVDFHIAYFSLAYTQ